MNPAKHFKSLKKERFIGTFISVANDGNPLFGWSRFNHNKEKTDGVSFSKKVGRDEAVKSTEKQITIDTSTNFLYKGDNSIHDPEMVKAAIDFITRMKKYYKKAPVNVKIIFTIEYLKEMIQDVMEQNKKLKEMNMKLIHEKLQIEIENDSLGSKLKRIKECID